MTAAAALRIEGEMSIYRASELKQMLLTALQQSDTLEIDLSAVTELDTAGVQLLVLAKKTAQARHCNLQLVAHSPVVLQALELLNLVAYFGDPLVIPSINEASK